MKKRKLEESSNYGGDQGSLIDYSLYCICKRPYSDNELMIGKRLWFILECGKCENWFHFECVGIIGNQDEMENVEYYCDECKATLDRDLLVEMLENSYSIYTSEKIAYIESLLKQESVSSAENSKFALKTVLTSEQEESDLTIFKLKKLN